MARSAVRTLIASLMITALAGPALAAKKAEETGCKRPIKLPGQPHVLQSIAEINAISNWSEAARKHGADYSEWFYAKGQSMECTKIGSAGMFLCHAGGKPCRPPEEVRAGATKERAKQVTKTSGS